MDKIYDFDARIEQDTVVFRGTAGRPATDRAPAASVAFSLVLTKWTDLWDLEAMLTEPLDRLDVLPVNGAVVTSDATIRVRGIRVRPFVSWAERSLPQILLGVEVFDEDVAAGDHPDDFAIALLDLGPEEWAQLRDEVDRVGEEVRALHPLVARP